MSIFGRKSVVTENYSVAAEEGFVETTLGGLQAILAESARDAYKLEAGMYISDVIMEEAVIEGAADAEVLLEGFVKNTWEKIKEAIQKLWAKVKSWFEAIKRKLQIIFTSGEKFVKKFRNEIREKSVKGFKYTGFKYTIDSGVAHIEKQKGVIIKFLDEKADFRVGEGNYKQDEQSASLSAHGTKESYDTSEAKEELLRALGDEDQSKILEEASKAFRNGSDEKEEIEEFAGTNKEEMMKFIEDGAGKIREIEKAQAEIDTQFNRVLNALNKAKGAVDKLENAEEGAKGKMTAFATHKATLAQFGLSLLTSLAGVHVKAIQEAAREYERVLKTFLSYKPAKEGWNPVSENTVESDILGAAMRHL